MKNIETLRAALARYDQAHTVLARSSDERELDRTNPVAKAGLDEAVDRHDAVIVAARALHSELEAVVVEVVARVGAKHGFTSPEAQQIAPLALLPPASVLHGVEAARGLIDAAERIAEAQRIAS